MSDYESEGTLVALNENFDAQLRAAIDKLKEERVYKRLNYLASAQDARVQMEGRGEVVILSSNNYLGLSNDPAVVAAGIKGPQQIWAPAGRVRPLCDPSTILPGPQKAHARRSSTP